MKNPAFISQHISFVSMMYIFNKIDRIEIAAIISIPIEIHHQYIPISLSIFIIKELPGVRIIRKEPDLGYALTPVSNSSGYRLYAGAKVKKKHTKLAQRSIHSRCCRVLFVTETRQAVTISYIRTTENSSYYK